MRPPMAHNKRGGRNIVGGKDRALKVKKLARPQNVTPSMVGNKFVAVKGAKISGVR